MHDTRRNLEGTYMRAVVTTRAGSADRLALEEVEVPHPGPGQLLVKVHATSVTRGDTVLRKMPRLVVRAFGESPKSVLGHEFSGTVVAIGLGSPSFDIGDRVFGTTSGTPFGAHAEYVVVPDDSIVATIPPGVSHVEAASVPVGAMTALHFLNGGGIGEDASVLINGASGSVGSFAVQIAKARGATVVGVCSGDNAELVSDLGADEVIDYRTTDIRQLGRRFDTVFDTAGVLRPRGIRDLLADGGAFVTTRTRRDETIGEMLEVRDLLACGSIRAVVGRTVDLAGVPDAHRLVEGGHKVGNVLVQVSTEEDGVHG